MDKFGNAITVVKTLGIELPQHHEELADLFELFTGELRYLEVGARYGGSLFVLAQAIQPGGDLVVIDMPGGPWGRGNSEPVLEVVLGMLRVQNYNASIYWGNSTGRVAIDFVDDLLPDNDFVCLIDGDHAYEGVRADWENHGKRAKMCAFHDIANDHSPGPNPQPMGVKKFYNELIETGEITQHAELVSKNSKFGIGVVWPSHPEGV